MATKVEKDIQPTSDREKALKLAIEKIEKDLLKQIPHEYLKDVNHEK